MVDDEEAEDIRLSVLLPVPHLGPLDYKISGDYKITSDVIPQDSTLKVGSYVSVPLAGRTETGIVWGPNIKGAKTQGDDKTYPLEKLKYVNRVLDVPPMPDDLMKMVSWVSNYTMAPLGSVLKMAMNTKVAIDAAPIKNVYFKGGDKPPKMTEARTKALDWVGEHGAQSVSDIAKGAGVSDAVVRGLIKLGTLMAIEQSSDAPYPKPDLSLDWPPLSDEQQVAAEGILSAVDPHHYKAFLLEGVTGSGKTEVYFDTIRKILAADDTAQILVLLPEIALTSQWLDRFEARFGVAPVQWHSDLGQAERRRAWHKIAEGDAKSGAKGGASVVVAARSGLFLPFKNLKLIVVDEEHDPSFKQEEGVLYQARDMAVLRANLLGIPIVLASATPSYESLLNIQEGKYEDLRLHSRFGEASLPEITVIDMREDAPPTGRWISPVLEAAIRETLERNEQVLLFLNRRGYAPLTLCRTCGERINCPNCSAWLVEHRYRNELCCHHCGHSIPKPKVCPTCENEDTLVACGPGIERLTEEVANLFPEARRLVMTSDTVTSPEVASAAIGQISSGAVDIVMGTQIVTKGYHFPGLTLVGVIDADLGLKGGDLRAGERTYQQLMQVAGRAGREHLKGHVYLQTYMPEHPVTKAMVEGDREGFLAEDLAGRKRFDMPPYGKLAGIIISGGQEAQVMAAARKLASSAPFGEGISILGPAPAPFHLLRGQFRYRLLVKAARKVGLQKTIRAWLVRAGKLKGVKVKVDIDPYSFL